MTTKAALTFSMTFFFFGAFLALLLLHGCAATTTSHEETCVDLAARYQLWNALAVGTKVAVATGALSTALPNDDHARIALGLGTAAMTGASAAFESVAEDVGGMWNAQCTETASVADGQVTE